MTLGLIHTLTAREAHVDTTQPLKLAEFLRWYELATAMKDHAANTRARLEVQYARSTAHRKTLGMRKVRTDRSAVHDVDLALLHDVSLTSSEVAARLDGVSASAVRKKRAQLGIRVPRKTWAAGGASWTSTGTNGSSRSTRATSTRS